MTDSIKTRPSKTKSFIWKFVPHHPLHHIPLLKYQKELFVAQKSLRLVKLLRVLNDKILFKFHSDRILFVFSSERVLLRVLSDRVIIEFSVIGSSSWSSVIESSLGSSMFFFFLVVICCHLLSLVVIFLYHLLLLDAPLVCLFINHRNWKINPLCESKTRLIRLSLYCF